MHAFESHRKQKPDRRPVELKRQSSMTRVGAAEKAAFERLGMRVIDASQAGWGIINHDLFLSNAEVRRVIRRSIDAAAA